MLHLLSSAVLPVATGKQHFYNYTRKEESKKWKNNIAVSALERVFLDFQISISINLPQYY